MVGSLAIALLALRAGLAMRHARLRRIRPPRGAYRRHLRLAKLALFVGALGAIAGPLSMLWLRGREPFGTAHALLASATLLLYATTALIGWRISRRRTAARDIHALLALLATLGAAASAISGFVLLP